MKTQNPFEVHAPSKEETQAALKELFEAQKIVRAERRTAALAAVPALQRLIEVCRSRSGQSYKIRAMIYSLWNGQPTDLSEMLCLDWALRKDLAAVILAFGFEHGDVKFFYDAISDAFKAAGLYDWFLEQAEAEPISSRG